MPSVVRSESECLYWREELQFSENEGKKPQQELKTAETEAVIPHPCSMCCTAIQQYHLGLHREQGHVHVPLESSVSCHREPGCAFAAKSKCSSYVGGGAWSDGAPFAGTNCA